MVLSDHLFADLSLDTMQSIFRPKVEGSMFLDELYANDDLDFFILFGSMAGPMGNRGQSAYSAATTFMSSIIQGRRARGLVGSIINPGEISGVGYVARLAHLLSDALADSFGSLALSERDLHELFAEGILAGRRESGHSPELIAGVAACTPSEQPNIIWYPNPRAWHFVNHFRSTTSRNTTSEAVPVKVQLESASSMHEAAEIVESGFIAKLRNKLQLSEEDTLTRENLLVELGVDSLVAVDLRTWFVKELNVDMPILKLLGGSSIGELVDDAISKLPETLLAHLADDSGETTAVERNEHQEKQQKNDDSSSQPTPERASTPAQASTPERVSTPATEESSDGVVLRSKFNPLTAADFVRLRAASMSSGSVYASSQTDDDSISSFEIGSFDNNEIVPYYEKIERLSFSQSRYWFLNQYLEDKSAYNVSFLFSFTTLPRIEDLQAAVRTVGMRHETLRTCYIMAGGESNEPYQAITPTSRLELEICHVDDETEAQEQYARIRDHVYDLDNGEVARIRLVITPSNTQYLIMGYHHMAMDAASFEVFLMELSRAYTHQPLPPVSRQYTDYAAAQRDAYECGDMQKELAYWRKEFQTTPDPIPLLPMAKTRSRQVLKEYALEELQCKVGASTMRKIKDACKKSRATPFHFFLAALRVFLARLTEADDFCIGVADANRLDPANQNTIGFLLNLLPVRFTSTSTQQSFKQILGNTREKALGALRHSKLPFDKMLDDLGVTRSTAYSPLFQVLVDWQPRSGGSRKFADITTETVDMQPGKTGYDLTLLITDSDNGESTINFRLQKSLYSRSGAELVARSFVNLVESLAMDFDRNAYEAPLYPKSDLQHAIGLGAGPSMTAQWPSTISKRIDQVAGHHANDIAVKDPSGRAFTYSQLMNRVDIVASALVKAGVQSGSRVCLFQHPTAEWVSCMLATWRLNAVYVPLDLRNPVPRLAAMVQDCQPQVILCHDESKADVTGLNSPSKVINVSELSFDSKVAPIENMSSAESPAAILYSSGSTGRPKGIQLGHLGLVNNMEGLCMRWKVGAETVLQQGAMTFDHSLDQLLVGLSNGGRLIVVPRSMRGDPSSLSKLMVEEKVTYTKATPAEYLMWLRYASDVLRNNDNWRFAFLGGEHVTTSLVDGFRDLGLPNLHLFNSYGPAEISIASHKGEIDYNAPRSSSGNVYPAGYSLPNYTTYIVDKNMKPVPQGVSGEILIGGAGPCMGYVNLDSLTQEKFIVNPLVSAEYRSQGWTTAYRTFDRGHLLSDGSLVIEGRLDGDTQVKLRGIRMELEEIENAILDTSRGVLINAIVSRREEGDNQFLVAHVTFASHFQGDKAQFLKQLRGNLPLPQYMWPSIAIPVDELPLNVHGKVDRKAVNAFPLPKRSKSSGTSVADLTEAESLMRDVWEKVLDDGLTDLSNVNSETNFFLVGGNSVLLVKLQATIKETMGVSIPLAELFEASTLGGMAEKAQAIQPTTVINWEQETSVDELIEFAQHSQEHSPKDQDVTVILTGATGFLGKRILNLLESNPAVSRIHAVAVRPNSNRTLDASSSKLVVHHGDLSAPLLGLDDDTFASLAEAVDLVIHCGANRSFWDAYPVLRGSNVTGTRSLIALASQKRAPIHFMSSGGVADITDVPPTDGSDGYIASKWASEQLLRNATEKLGIQTIIHRPVQADNLQPPSDALVNELNDVIQRIRAVPIEGSWNGTFTLMPADEMAEQVIASALSGTDVADVTIQQHVATVQLRMEEVMKINDLATPGTLDGFERLPAVKWLGRAKREGGFGWFVAAHNAVMGNGDVSMASRR
jgi:hybrid polyketide synthase/nonribosomal peptide synthetase ACE1